MPPHHFQVFLSLHLPFLPNCFHSKMSADNKWKKTQCAILSPCPKSFMSLTCQNNALQLPEIILLVLNINFSICSSLNGDARFVQKLICSCLSNLPCWIKHLPDGLGNFLKACEPPLKTYHKEGKDRSGWVGFSRSSTDTEHAELTDYHVQDIGIKPP